MSKTVNITPANITSLKSNQVFVFGSNTKGIHGKGAAYLAKTKWGATEGMSFGHSGQTFAIPTKDGKTFARRSVSLAEIEASIISMLLYANDHQQWDFLVTKIGCGLSGYSDSEIAACFKDCFIPSNVSLPIEFIKLLGYTPVNQPTSNQGETHMSNFNFVEAGKNGRLTLVNLYDFLKENPVTYKEALFLGWISKESGFNKAKREELKKTSSIIVKLDVDDAEVALDYKLSPYRMVAGLNYLNYLKSIKGSILPPDFEAALVNKTLKVTTLSNKLAKYIACWYPGYTTDSEIEPSELEDSDAPCLCDDFSALPQSYTGTVYTTQHFADWWMLPADAPFQEMLMASATAYDKDKAAFQVSGHTWINWNAEESIVTLVNKQRISRSIYTIKGVENFFVEDPMMMWGNFLVQFVMNGGSEDYLSLLINRDATELLTPSVVYGDISPLNHAVNHDTVGHLTVHLNRPSDDGCTVGFDFRNDKSAYAAADAAHIAMQKGMPVLFQHQLEKVRIGKGAQALGKSTIKVYVKLDKSTIIESVEYPAGSLVLVDLILGQDEVDKAAKLFNRDALCVRVTPGVRIIFPDGFSTNEDLANELESFAASLLA